MEDRVFMTSFSPKPPKKSQKKQEYKNPITDPALQRVKFVIPSQRVSVKTSNQSAEKAPAGQVTGGDEGSTS